MGVPYTCSNGIAIVGNLWLEVLDLMFTISSYYLKKEFFSYSHILVIP